MKISGLNKGQAASFLAAAITTLGNTNIKEMAGQDNIQNVKQKIVDGMSQSGVDAEGFDATTMNFSLGKINKFNYDGDVKVVGASAGDLKGLSLDGNALDIESFDRLDTQNNEKVKLAAINLVNQNMARERDGIISLCSIATIDASQTGKSFTALAPSVTYGAVNNNGALIGGTKVPLISNLDDASIFGTGKKEFLPLLRTTGDYPTDSFLLTQTGVTSTITYEGQTAVTAPIAVGQEINLRRLCSTPAYLAANGAGANTSITLSADGELRNVYITLTDATDGVNILKFPVTGWRGSRYTSTTAGSAKDLTMNFTGELTLKVADQTAKGILVYKSGANAILDDGGDGYELKLKVSFTANTNTDSMVFTSAATKVTLVSVTDGGVPVDTANSTFTDFKALIDVAVLSGVDIKHYLSNSNNADSGILIDIDALQYEIPAVYDTPVTFNKSVLSNDVSIENLPGYLAAANITNDSVLASSIFGLVDAFISDNKDKADAETGVLTGVSVDGVGKEYVKPLIITDTINASDRLSMKSIETKQDIGTFIYDTIVSHAATAFSASNLDKAASALYPGEKIVLKIATGSKVAEYLTTAANNATKGRFEVQVETSSKLGDRAIATLEVGGQVTEISPVILVEAPDFIYKATEAFGTGTKEVTKIVPRRKAVINCPVFIDVNITNITPAYAKA